MDRSWDADEPHALGLSLSGGGHRATLFTLGGLLAIVDRGLNREVDQISSVSGGSITNAFIAQRCHFEKLRPGEFDSLARELIDRVVTRGVLSRARILTLVVTVLAIGTGSGVLLGLVAPLVIALVGGLIVAFGALLLSGSYVGVASGASVLARCINNCRSAGQSN